MGRRVDAAAILPLDAASHCGYEEENRDERNISHDFWPLSSQVSASKYATAVVN